jgi:hypothetical protein
MSDCCSIDVDIGQPVICVDIGQPVIAISVCFERDAGVPRVLTLDGEPLTLDGEELTIT